MPVKRVIKKTKKKNKCWQEYGKKKPLCTVGRIVNWYSHYGNSMEVPQKIKNRTAI